MTWLQTASGRAFDLLAPCADMVDFETDVPEALARIARFTGHVRSGVYSVAQHCCLGSDLFLRRDDAEAARAFLLHDAHEAYLGDIATPIAQALATFVDDGHEARMARPRHVALPEVRVQIADLKRRVDRAVYAAAGLPWPLSADLHWRVTEMDVAMLNAERRALMGPAPRRWAEAIEAATPAPIGRLPVWPWPKAADEYRARLHRLFPALKRAA